MSCTSHEKIRNTTDGNNHLSSPNCVRYSRLTLDVPQRPFKSCAKKQNPSQLCPEDLQFLVTERPNHRSLYFILVFHVLPKIPAQRKMVSARKDRYKTSVPHIGGSTLGSLRTL